MAVRSVSVFAGRLSVRCGTVGFQVQLFVDKEIVGMCISMCLVSTVRSVGSGDSDGAGQSSQMTTMMMMMTLIMMMTMIIMTTMMLNVLCLVVRGVCVGLVGVDWSGREAEGGGGRPHGRVAGWVMGRVGWSQHC